MINSESGLLLISKLNSPHGSLNGLYYRLRVLFGMYFIQCWIGSSSSLLQTVKSIFSTSATLGVDIVEALGTFF